MANYNKYQCFVADLAHGVHNFTSHDIKVAFSNTAPNAATHVKLADVTAVDASATDNLKLTKSTDGQTSGTYTYLPSDLTIAATGAVGPFRYVIIYNDTATNDPLICYFDYASAVTLASGDTFKLDFGTELFSLA